MENLEVYRIGEYPLGHRRTEAPRRVADGIKIHAIPTVYRGRQFRSRLEAKWAAFFDLMKWNWDYEPIDLNGWIPDFVVGDFATGAYVEVKPIDWAAGQYLDAAMKQELDHAAEQVPPTSRGFLILGLRPFEGWPVVHLGAVVDPCDARGRIGRPALSKHRETGQFDLAIGHGPYPGLMTGLDFKDQDWTCGDEVLSLWIEAGNLVQYKGKKAAQ